MDDNQPTTEAKAQPTHDVRVQRADGGYETIGAAWPKDNGGLWVKLSGEQIITRGFYVLPRRR